MEKNKQIGYCATLEAILNDNIKDGELVCRDSADVFYMFLLETEKNILEVRLKEILEKIRTSSECSNSNL